MLGEGLEASLLPQEATQEAALPGLAPSLGLGVPGGHQAGLVQTCPALTPLAGQGEQG